MYHISATGLKRFTPRGAACSRQVCTCTATLLAGEGRGCAHACAHSLPPSNPPVARVCVCACVHVCARAHTHLHQTSCEQPVPRPSLQEAVVAVVEAAAAVAAGLHPHPFQEAGGVAGAGADQEQQGLGAMMALPPVRRLAPETVRALAQVRPRPAARVRDPRLVPALAAAAWRWRVRPPWPAVRRWQQPLQRRGWRRRRRRRPVLALPPVPSHPGVPPQKTLSPAAISLLAGVAGALARTLRLWKHWQLAAAHQPPPPCVPRSWVR